MTHTRGASHAVRQEKGQGWGRHWNCRGGRKSVFIDNIIIYVENPVGALKTSTKPKKRVYVE